MKKILLVIIMLVGIAYGQTVGYFRYDTSKFLKNGGTSEVKILNSTKSKTNGVFKNIGDGWGKWLGVVDTIYRTAGKDSLFFTIAGTIYAIKDSTATGTVTSVTATSPISITGVPTVTPNVQMTAAASGVEGYVTTSAQEFTGIKQFSSIGLGMAGTGGTHLIDGLSSSNGFIRLSITGSNSGSSTGIGSIYTNNLGSALQFYQGSSTNSFVPDGAFFSSTGANGYKFGHLSAAKVRWANSSTAGLETSKYLSWGVDSFAHIAIPKAANMTNKRVLVYDSTNLGNFYQISKDSVGGGAWLLASGGTLTGTNTITSGTNPIIFSTGVTTGTGATAGIQEVYNSLTSGNGKDQSSSSLSTGNILKITSTSTAANAGSLLNINSSGANANATRTAIGQTISVTNTGTTSTNVGLNVTSTGATTNYAALLTGGTNSTIGINIAAPTSTQHTTGTFAITYTSTGWSDGGSYDVGANPGYHFRFVDAAGAGAAMTVNIPDAHSCAGRIYYFSMNGVAGGGNTLEFTPAAGSIESIDGTTSAFYSITFSTTLIKVYAIQSDGTDWRIISATNL